MDKKYKPTRISLVLRMVVAAYILYLAYGLLTSPEPKVWYMWVFIFIFAVFGIYFLIVPGMALAKGEYQEAEEDDESDDQSNDDTSSTVDAGSSNSDTTSDSTVDNTSDNEETDDSKEVIIEEVTNAEEFQGGESMERLMGMYEGSTLEVAKDSDIESLD